MDHLGQLLLAVPSESMDFNGRSYHFLQMGVNGQQPQAMSEDFIRFFFKKKSVIRVLRKIRVHELYVKLVKLDHVSKCV